MSRGDEIRTAALLAAQIASAYVVACALSSHVFMDLRLTDWGNAWVYVWWVLGMPAGFFMVVAGAYCVGTMLALLEKGGRGGR